MIDLDVMLEQIRAQAAVENIRVTQHAQQEMVEEGIVLDQVLEAIATGKFSNKMGNANSKEVARMKCSIEGCPGEYEERGVVHTVCYHGKIVVIDHVPAEVCSVCGDVLLRPGTVRQIERSLQTETRPASLVPLYEYA